jgi:hypothetical protein
MQVCLLCAMFHKKTTVLANDMVSKTIKFVVSKHFMNLIPKYFSKPRYFYKNSKKYFAFKPSLTACLVMRF